ncbi:DNA polymerase III subunit delta [Teredinibacter sp. KSP-S5-2]|uniref:DNA polymerase III subunit delta n=1 Tax=Teredinibacter sp. KSP-S5-2 TaxID=3034506 RepID=UPI0029351ADF|nr:DNA polymerase III subunit delta [Teredinibacter sp. KSP-S5-2]WNO09539.1 DNA polymerase III subunit delta [Teredinibacter sp. KSP-S5-2]
MARLRIEQLENALSKRIAPIYVVSGDEPLLIQEACDLIRQQAHQAGYDERELYHTDAGFTWETLLQSANSMSLFSEKKIIEVRVINGKLGDAGAKAIIEYCSRPSDDNLLLLVFPKLDKKTQNSKWHKALDSVADILQVWPVAAHQLPRWIEQRLKQAGLTAEPQAIEILCAKVEGNLLAAVQEVEKLKLIADSNHLDAQTMSNAVMDSARYDVFNLTNKALSGDSRAAVANLHGLKAEGTEAPIVLWALTREIRTLATIKEALQLGQSFDQVAQRNGVWDNRKTLVKQALHRLDLKILHQLIRKCLLADKSIKGIANEDTWNLLLEITINLAGTQALSPKSNRLALQSGN